MTRDTLRRDAVEFLLAITRYIRVYHDEFTGNREEEEIFATQDVVLHYLHASLEPDDLPDGADTYRVHDQDF